MATTPPPPRSDPSSDNKPSPPKGWLDDIAHRSAGIMPHTPPEPTKPQRERTPWSYAGLGIEFAGTTALFALGGYYIDGHFQTMPWATLALSSVGFVGGMYLLIKDALKENAAPHKDTGKDSPPQG